MTVSFCLVCLGGEFPENASDQWSDVADSDADAENREEHGDDIPEYVKEQRHFVTFYKKYMKERITAQAELIGRSSSITEFTSNFVAIKHTMNNVDQVNLVHSI